MVLGIMDLDIDLAGIGGAIQENVYNAIEKAKSIFGQLASYIYMAIRWVIDKVWMVMQIAYQKAIEFFYDYIELAHKNPKAFAKMSLGLMILYGR